MNKLKHYCRQFLANIFYQEIKRDSAKFLTVALQVAWQTMLSSNTESINVSQNIIVEWKKYLVQSTYWITLTK